MSKHKINKVIILLKVKVEITASGDDGDKDLLPKFLLLREVRLRLERVWNTMLTRSQRGPPYSPHALTNAICRESTIGLLRGVTKPVQMATLGGGHRTHTNARGNLHNQIGGSCSVPKLYTTMIELRNNKPLGANAPKRNKLYIAYALKRTSSRVSMHSRVTIFSTSLTTTNPRRELKPMHQMQWQEHTKCSSPPVSNPTKATKAMEEYERKNTEKHQELQDLDPQGSPHLE